MKTSKLTGAALDWAVAKCEGLLLPDGGNLQTFNKQLRAHPAKLGTLYTPSIDWAQGGPIIEREGIAIGKSWEGWKAFTETSGGEGPTPLIAAMRCYVASKLGDEVELPEGLQ
jgi:hypothetical protein